MTKNNAVNGGLIGRFLEQAENEQKWYDTVDADNIEVITDVNGYVVTVEIGDESYDADARALNFTSMGMWAPKWTFDTLRQNASYGLDEVLSGMSGELFRAPSPDLKDEMWDAARPLGYIRTMTEVGTELTSLHNETDTLRVYESISRNSTELNTGANPLRRTNEFYMYDGAVRIEVTDPTEPQSETIIESAASW
jgi:hypothetical protein